MREDRGSPARLPRSTGLMSIRQQAAIAVIAGYLTGCAARSEAPTPAAPPPEASLERPGPAADPAAAVRRAVPGGERRHVSALARARPRRRDIRALRRSRDVRPHQTGRRSRGFFCPRRAVRPRVRQQDLGGRGHLGRRAVGPCARPGRRARAAVPPQRDRLGAGRRRARRGDRADIRVARRRRAHIADLRRRRSLRGRAAIHRGRRRDRGAPVPRIEVGAARREVPVRL
jgi:hypothetical protein